MIGGSIEQRLRMMNACYWYYYGEDNMAKACKFCVFLNSYVCDNQDCIDCGQCKK